MVSDLLPVSVTLSGVGSLLLPDMNSYGSFSAAVLLVVDGLELSLPLDMAESPALLDCLLLPPVELDAGVLSILLTSPALLVAPVKSPID